MNKTIRLLLIATLALVVSACSHVAIVDHGDAVVGERLVMKVDNPWNRFEGPAAGPIPTWTRDGFSVDSLQFFVGVKNGEPLAPRNDKQTPRTFASGMRPHEVVSLFESLYTRDGSTFTLQRLAPERFLHTDGFRFEFASVRKFDEVILAGVGWGAILDGQLTAMVYTAPRLYFFDRHLHDVENLTRSALLR